MIPPQSPWIPVIGLEVHCQLKTRTKLFCGCRNAFGAPPNSLTCPVCAGHPGALPALNAEALRLAYVAGHALRCTLAKTSAFDRKNYFYCDLPKGYQITQFERPFCTGGGIDLASGRTVRLTRIHLEEDAGKAIHDRGSTTLVDLNRAGIPLIELVTEPDLQSSEEAYEYLNALKEILRFAGVSDCDMEKGSLRCDVNVSVRPAGAALRPRVEIKNLNSFRNVARAIDYEVARQIEAYERGDAQRYPEQETRLYDASANRTRSMRGKEDARDYRYFPDPDLGAVCVDDAFLKQVESAVPELPAALRSRYASDFGLSEYDARVMTDSPAVAELFERTVALGASAKSTANWIANDVLGSAVASDGLASSRLTSVGLAELLALLEAGTLSRAGARQILARMLASGGDPAVLAAEMGLEQVRDADRIEAWCRAALEQHPDVAGEFRNGNSKALGVALGAVMRASNGAADPRQTRSILERLIEQA